jgi:hypothetical protein
MAALACFALPFLTVTCYGETTVSGVQAATEIDLSPDDHPGERELFREESANGFALVALVAAVVGVIAAFASAGSPRVVWASAVGAIALQGLFAYASYRSWFGAWPRIGFTGALVLLVAAAWTAAGSVPRWAGVLTACVAISMIPASVMRIEDIPESPFIYLPVYSGGFIALFLAVGAIRASRQPRRAGFGDPRPSTLRPSTLRPSTLRPSTLRPSTLRPSTLPSTPRMVVAGIVGAACLAAAAVVSPFLMGAIGQSEYGPGAVPWGYAFGLLVIAIGVVASAAGWVAGDAIAHGGRRSEMARMRAGFGAS